MLWLARLRTLLATLRYPAAWALSPRLARSLRASLRHLRPVLSPVGIVLHPYAPPIGGRAFGRYLQGLRRMARGEHVPLVVHLSVTDRCPNACRRCSNLPCSEGDPPLEALIPLIEKLRQAGTVSIALTGGEPMLRPDLPEIIAACAPDISVTLFTTGFGIDEAAARRLRGAGLELAFISLDHARPEPHDRQRGRAGAHRQAVQAIRACRAAGLYTAAQAVAEAALFRDGALEDYLEFCRGLGVHEVMLLEPVAVRPDQAAAPFAPDLRARLVDLHQRAVRDASLPKVSCASFLESPEFLGCQAGYSFLYISAAGELFPCDFAPISLGNVYRESLGALLARAGQDFAAPACHCLAHAINQSCGAEFARPLSHAQASGILNHFKEPGLPQLMLWLDQNHPRGKSSS
jgi:MoaA/NifB/PqqE/SkfB family radical SAM enzyme